MIFALLFLQVILAVCVNVEKVEGAATCDDYSKLVELSTLFYEAQRSGMRLFINSRLLRCSTASGSRSLV